MVSEKFFEDLSDNEIRVADLQISEEYTYIKEIVLPKKQSILDYFKGTYIEAFEDNYRTYITRNNFFNNIQQYDYKIVLHDHVDTIVNSYIPFLLPHLKNKSITGMKFKNTKTPPVKKHSGTLNTFIVYVPKRSFGDIHNLVKNLTTKTPLIIDVAKITDPERI